MKIKALTSWFGGKRILAKTVVKYLGEHQAYFEPFAGSLSVLFSKPVCRMETVNDFHKDIINLARVVQDPKKCGELDWRLRRTLCSEYEFGNSLEYLNTNPEPFPFDLERAYHYFVVSWLGMNGFGGLEDFPSFSKRFTSTGGDPATRFRNAVDCLPEWFERLKNVTICNMDGLEICERIEDSPQTVCYCDPPYIQKTGVYKHDFTPDDHRRLARALNRFEATRVVLSYYKNEFVDELYPDWQQIPLSVNKALGNTSKPEQTTKAPEILLVNFSLDASNG